MKNKTKNGELINVEYLNYLGTMYTGPSGFAFFDEVDYNDFENLEEFFECVKESIRSVGQEKKDDIAILNKIYKDYRKKYKRK